MSKFLNILCLLLMPLMVWAYEEALKLPEEIERLGLVNLSMIERDPCKYDFSNDNIARMRDKFTLAIAFRKEYKQDEAIKLFWQLAYDGYGPAIWVFTRAFTLNDEFLGIRENSNWASFFGRLPDTERQMILFSQSASCPNPKVTSIVFTDPFPPRNRTQSTDEDADGERPVETLLRSTYCVDVSDHVREVLKIYHQRGMTYKQISAKFGCSESLVQKFLTRKDPAHKLVANVHAHYKNGGASLADLSDEEDAPEDATVSSTWYSGLVSWFRPQPTTSSRSSEDGASSDDAHRSHDTQSSGDEASEESRTLLNGSGVKYIMGNKGLRHRHKPGAQK
ncbi:MAG: hypothetical protein Q8K36_03180 [Alphaproteobacteria bacterium]|nr:hypothetical protein [Alphaproteobacteria bacterium]